MMHGSTTAPALNQAVPDPSPELLARASSLRRHAIDLAQCIDQQRQEALLAMAEALEQQREAILSANQKDRQAAEQGHVDAQRKLGDVYFSGTRVEESAERAVEWHTKAAELGGPDAQFQLAIRYKDGEGVPEDDFWRWSSQLARGVAPPASGRPEKVKRIKGLEL